MIRTKRQETRRNILEARKKIGKMSKSEKNKKMRMRYIALGSVVMLLFLLRKKKPKVLTVDQVGPVIVHGDDDKGGGVRLEASDVSLETSEASETTTDSNGACSSTESNLVDSPVETSATSETTTDSNGAGISTVESKVKNSSSILQPLGDSLVLKEATTNNVGGISTTSEVSVGEAIVNKLDKLLAEKSDDYTNWIKDEERKSRDDNSGIVGISTASGSFE